VERQTLRWQRTCCLMNEGTACSAESLRVYHPMVVDRYLRPPSSQRHEREDHCRKKSHVGSPEVLLSQGDVSRTSAGDGDGTSRLHSISLHTCFCQHHQLLRSTQANEMLAAEECPMIRRLAVRHHVAHGVIEIAWGSRIKLGFVPFVSWVWKHEMHASQTLQAYFSVRAASF
jgi:hypothetical protein